MKKFLHSLQKKKNRKKQVKRRRSEDNLKKNKRKEKEDDETKKWKQDKKRAATKTIDGEIVKGDEIKKQHIDLHIHMQNECTCVLYIPYVLYFYRYIGIHWSSAVCL